ncbi:MAG: DUF1015 domain-containing protein [Polyangiaceae bacterium]|jgi:uncharacterized protein (DUF1015 family)
MAEIAPLTPLRYDANHLPGGLASVVAPPYDVISPAERAVLAARDPHNVVQLILPEGEGDSKYANAARILGRWRAEGTLVRDAEPGFYRYDQSFIPPGGGARRTRRGFLALVRLVPFSKGVVLPHERTLAGPKEDRLKLFRATQTNLSPGFMLYRDSQGRVAPALSRAETISEFVTPDAIEHTLAKVRDGQAVRAIVEGLAHSTLLIADGHHRYETALRYSDEVDAAHAGAAPRGEHRYFMTFLADGDSPDLIVFPTHRHVHSLASFSFDELVRRAQSHFDVVALPPGSSVDVLLDGLRDAARRGPTVAAAVADGRSAWFTLKADADLDAHPVLGSKPSVLRRTDVAILHAGILEALLGITPEAQAAKTNLWYPQDARAALADLRGGRGQVLFLMNATPVAQVRAVAEAGEVMPQKSTFFYPKVLTGLAIHTLDPERPIAHV